MAIEIDQSGKIEDTSKDTALGLSNSVSDSVVIKSHTKRQLQTFFRLNKLDKKFVLLTFSVLISILINRLIKNEAILIDQEYIGNENTIKSYLHAIILKKGVFENIRFGLIGKKSNAHHVAHDTATKELKPGKVVSFEEIIREIKKTEVGNRLKNA